MRQTTVEWLIDQLTEYNYLWNTDKPDDMVEFLSIIPQAKEMEKKQIIDSYKADRYPCSDEDAEQYYNETYKSK